MKKLTVLFLSFALITNLCFAALAEQESDIASYTKVSKEQAIAISKKTIKTAWNYNIPSDSKVYAELDKSCSKFGADDWFIEWTIDDNDNRVYIDICVDSNSGTIKEVSFDKANRLDTSEAFNIISVDEAKETANSFIKKIDSGIYKDLSFYEITFEESYNYSLNYILTYVRKLNGKSVSQNYAKIIINGKSNKVNEFKLEWDETLTQPIQNRMSTHKVMKLLKDSLKLRPQYSFISSHNSIHDESHFLSYDTNLRYAYAIDANKGTLIDYFGSEIYYKDTLNITDEKKEAIYKEPTAVSNTDIISKEEAEATIAEYIKIIYGESYKIYDTSYTEDSYYKLKLWKSKIAVKNDSDEAISGTMTINALTKELYGTYLTIENNEYVLSSYDDWVKNYNKSIELISKLFPSKIKEIITEVDCLSRYSGDYSFNRLINGIEYVKNGIGVYFDKNNNVFGMSHVWIDTELPENKDLINIHQAQQKYFEDYKPEPFYALVNVSGDYYNPEYVYKLVYNLPNNYYQYNSIDAKTGELLNYDESRNIKKVDLTLEISRYEAISKIIEANSYVYNYYNSYETPLFADIELDNKYYDDLKLAIKFGIIENNNKNFNGDDKITRIELAEMLINSLGYKEIVKHNRMYKVTFIDSKLIDKSKLGYAVISDGLGLIKADNKRFNPKGTVSKIDFAITMCYFERYINKIKK